MDTSTYKAMRDYEETSWWHDSRRIIIKKIIHYFFVNHNNPKRNVLEIGAGSGGNLSMLSEFGDLYAIELHRESREFAKSRKICPVKEGKLPNDIPFRNNFDLVCLFDVLEHLSNPREILDKVHESLVDGGNVFIYVPNWNSATRQLLKEENSHFIWPSHHLTYFTPETLKEFIERSGFEVFFWETQGLDLADFKWFLDEKENKDTKWIEEHGEILQYYINASGNGKNLRMFAKKVSK